MENTLSTDVDVHRNVLREFRNWIGVRQIESSLTVKFGDSPDTAIYIWTYLHNDQAEHLVVRQHNRLFTRWEIKYGDIGDLVRSLQSTHQHPQNSLVLQCAGGV